MTTTDEIRTADLQDTKSDVKVALCGLWISMLFGFVTSISSHSGGLT